MRYADSGHDRLRGAGTGRGIALIAWKTSGRIYQGNIAQLGGYQRMLAAREIARVAYAGVIRIDKETGEIEDRWLDMPRARRLFDLCLDVHLAAGELRWRRVLDWV